MGLYAGHIRQLDALFMLGRRHTTSFLFLRALGVDLADCLHGHW
jgi:hypothetical protein